MNNILISLFAPYCPANRHCVWNRHCHPEHSGPHPDLDHQFRPHTAPVFMLSSMTMKISPSPSPSPSSWLSSVSFSSSSVSLSSFFVPNRQLVLFVELHCRCIVNSSELVEIPLLHIKLPIPYNRLFSMPIFIKPTVPPHHLFAGEKVKKS